MTLNENTVLIEIAASLQMRLKIDLWLIKNKRVFKTTCNVGFSNLAQNFKFAKNWTQL